MFQIEGEISKKYHNRKVNIMGEINTIWEIYSSLFMLRILQGSTYPIAQMARGK